MGVRTPGIVFLRISSISLVLMVIDYMSTGVFQACGKSKQAFGAALGRKAIEIPSMLILDRLVSPYGMSAGELISEFVIGIIMFLAVRKFFNSSKSGENVIKA